VTESGQVPLYAPLIERIKARTIVPDMTNWSIADFNEEIDLLGLEVESIQNQINNRRDDCHDEFGRVWLGKARGARTHLMRRLRVVEAELSRRLHPENDESLREQANRIVEEIAVLKLPKRIAALAQAKIESIMARCNGEWEQTAVGMLPPGAPPDRAREILAFGLLERLVTGQVTLPLRGEDWNTYMAIKQGVRQEWCRRTVEELRAHVDEVQHG
jgi:hypothetical protein